MELNSDINFSDYYGYDGDGGGYGGYGYGYGYGYDYGYGGYGYGVGGYGYGVGDYGYGYGGYGYGGYGVGDYGYGDGDYGYDYDGDGGGYGYDYDSGGYGGGEKYFWLSLLNFYANKRAVELNKKGCAIAFWRSNKDGKPTNGGYGPPVKPGLIQEISGPLEICTKNALHGTLVPTKWNGDRIWMVAIYPPFVIENDKIASLKREIICELDIKI